jgi:hypothetical protein
MNDNMVFVIDEIITYFTTLSIFRFYGKERQCQHNFIGSGDVCNVYDITSSIFQRVGRYCTRIGVCWFDVWSCLTCEIIFDNEIKVNY